MSESSWVAVYAAAVGTISLGWNIAREAYKPTRFKYVVEADWDYAKGSGWSTPNEALACITVTNVGRKMIHIRKIVPIAENNKEGKTMDPPGLPITLNPGEPTTIVCDIAMAGDGWSRIELEDSTGKRYEMDRQAHNNLKKMGRPLIEWQKKIREAGQG